MATRQLFTAEAPEQVQSVLQRWHLRDPERGWRNLCLLKRHLTLEQQTTLAEAMDEILARSPDADMALNNLERLLARPEGHQRFDWLLQENARSLEVLLGLFGTSQYFSDLLVNAPGLLKMIRIPLKESPNREELIHELSAEIESSFDDSHVLAAFRRFRQRHLLRIGANDIVRDRPLEEIVLDISQVADAALECAFRHAYRKHTQSFGEPMTLDKELARCVILAFGKHGAMELNYSSDIDIMFLYDEEGQTNRKGRTISNSELYAKVAAEVVRLLSTYTEHGQAYRVDLRLRPEGAGGPMARSFDSTLSYYDTLGRTWERQALIKLRPVAGDLNLGESFLEAIEPFVYRRYLSFTEINGIKALKRKIEQRTEKEGATWTEVKTGHGGIRDIEFTIQFLQLLNGGDLPEIRQRDTLSAIRSLDKAGCLTDQESRHLEEAYRSLRRIEHFLQLMFDLQTHRLPENEQEIEKLARRLGAQPKGKRTAGEQFLADYRKQTEVTRQILVHLLHQTFQGEAQQADPVHDLILDPDPDEATIQRVLGRYRFRDVKRAYVNLMALARESIPFLSDRRCRHFLASIAPALLEALNETPDPDLTLVNLEKVSASLGGKSVLWESFSFQPLSLKLYVDICAWSSFLSEILINNPGMIDELLDTLVLNQPKPVEELRAELQELCQGVRLPVTQFDFGELPTAALRHANEREATSSLEAILHSFQDNELLRIGVADILGKSTVRETLRALSDLAETILSQIAILQYPLLVRRMGEPMVETGKGDEKKPCRFVLLGLGKLGGRELNYHSDLDLILVYEGDGQTRIPNNASRFDQITPSSNIHFFTELAQRIIKMTGQLGPLGRLYEVDMRLRPTGGSGSLVTPVAQLRRYYQDHGDAQLWERQAMTRARVVFGDEELGRQVMSVIDETVYGHQWQASDVDEIVSMRKRLEKSRSDRDLKRGVGGLVDVEFLVQMFHLSRGGAIPRLRQARNVWTSLHILQEEGILTEEEELDLERAYNFLLQVQSRLRMAHNRSLDELPDSQAEMEKLALRLGFEPSEEKKAGEILAQRLQQHQQRTRHLFQSLVDRERELSMSAEGQC